MIPGSRTKGFITHGTAGSTGIGVIVSVPLVLSFTVGDADGPSWDLHTQGP